MSLRVRLALAPMTVLAVVAVAALAVVSILRAATGGPVATKTFGQFDLLHNGVNIVTNAGLWNPQGVAVDRSVTPNRIYVADAGNHRVLGWRRIDALKDGSPADLVIGQADFLSWASQCNNPAVTGATLCFPTAVAVDRSGNLYVVDFGNNRVLEYDQPFTTDTQPDLVFGQGGSFTSSVCNKGGRSAATLCGPNGVAVDRAGNAYISDSGNSRVLEFDSSAGANPGAKLVFGQHGSFSSASCNADGVNADSLCRPSAVAVDHAGNLYVADHDNFRVLEYNAPRLANNTTADLVFGQNNNFFSNTNSCVAGASAGGLCTPDGLTVDGAGNLYIAGTSFSRVLEYNAPVATGHTSPDAVIGQPGFTASGCNNGGLGATGLCAPFGVGIDSANDLFVADFGNNRVVRYNNPLAAPAASTSANLVLGQISFAQNGVNLTKPDGLYWPAAVVVDTNSAPNHVYLADTNNSRVLGWFSVPELKYAGPPDLVIGQPGTRAGGCNQNHIDASGSSLPAANTLCTPGGVAVDPGGNLYVADSGNFRVLEYHAPFSSGKSTDLSANIVFGQNGSFTTRIQNNGGVSATSMAAPGGIATDKLGRLYVADPINNRVLEYNAPASGNTIADAVFGQGGSFAASACNFDGLCSIAGCLTTADSLCGPSAVVLNSAGRLYIADSANNRVLGFNNPLAVAKAADLVIGQADFNGLNCGRLCAPQGVAIDSAGDLFAANTANSVVNLYNVPLRTGMNPSLVIGHPQCDQAASKNDTLCGVAGLAFDPSGYLYASDTFDNRVVAFDLEGTPTATATATPVATHTPLPTASATATPRETSTPEPGQPTIDAIPAILRSGASFDIDGRGFTPGSKVNFFVATATGTVNTGPLTPAAFLPNRLTVPVATGNPLGEGVVAVQVVNTDRHYLASNLVTALLQGNPAVGIPSITGINGVAIDSDSVNPSIAVANVETVVAHGTLVTIDGAGFDTVNGVAVDLFCACPKGKVGPFYLNHGDPNLTATRVALMLPAAGPDAPPIGPGSFVVVNKGNDASFSRSSNAVSVPIGQRITVGSVSQSARIVAVDGSGFSVLTVINLFVMRGTATVNFGGLGPDGAPKIPLTLINGSKFSFSLPGAVVSGPAYVQALNPPFTRFTSSGNGPGGSFTVR